MRGSALSTGGVMVGMERGREPIVYLLGMLSVILSVSPSALRPRAVNAPDRPVAVEADPRALMLPLRLRAVAAPFFFFVPAAVDAGPPAAFRNAPNVLRMDASKSPANDSSAPTALVSSKFSLSSAAA